MELKLCFFLKTVIVFLCIHAGYLVAGASVDVVDVCDVKQCLEGTICVDGDCFPNPCLSLECSLGQKCVLEDVVCVTAPCIPVPSCQPADPCAAVRCESNFTCVNGDCVPVGFNDVETCGQNINPDGSICIEEQCYPNTIPTCADISCNFNEECYYQVVQERCPPTPGCRPVSCLGSLCPLGSTCEDGVCLPSTCENISCNDDEVCVMEPIDCFVAPCPDFLPNCVPQSVDYNCIATTCLEGTTCIEGNCVSNTCGQEGMSCGEGQECILERVPCLTPPCAVIATCVSTDDPCSLAFCGDGSICVDGDCLPFVPTCGDITCYFGEECFFETSQCSVSPCPLVPICKPRDHCVSVKCRPNYMCINGHCVRKTCNRFSCKSGEECYLHYDPCIAFRVPSCRPIRTLQPSK